MRLRLQIKKEQFISYQTQGTPQDFKDFMEEFLKWQADKVVNRIDEVIRMRLYNWHPLSESYKAWKEKMGLDPRIWIQTGQTKDSIHTWYNNMSDSYFIGVHPTKRHRAAKKGGGFDPKDKGARLLDIVRWLEFGTSRMKPRPLFTKVFREFEGVGRQQKLYSEFINYKKGLKHENNYR